LYSHLEFEAKRTNGCVGKRAYEGQQEQGKIDAAHQMLAEIYGWFAEGFDTLDLRDARALLEELA
jgi:hypothetical protein